MLVSSYQIYYYINEISILLAKTIVLQAKVILFSLKSIQIQAKEIDNLFSVTWSKTMCGMRNYLFILYFGSKDDLKCAHVFILTDLRLY